MAASLKCAGEHSYVILNDPDAKATIAFCTRCAKVINVDAKLLDKGE